MFLVLEIDQIKTLKAKIARFKSQAYFCGKRESCDLETVREMEWCLSMLLQGNQAIHDEGKGPCRTKKIDCDERTGIFCFRNFSKKLICQPCCILKAVTLNPFLKQGR
jgi:hypothetical protein